MSEQAITVVIPAQAEYVRVVRLALAGVASRMKFSFDQVEDIKLAVSEACNNAILHADPTLQANEIATVTVKLVPHADRLEITVSDEGHVPAPGLPPAKKRGAGLESSSMPTDQLPESGMGLLLIESLMDEVTRHTGAADRTTIHMVKRTAV